MFSKLLDNPELPLKEQKEVLKTVLTINLKQNIHEVRLQFNHNYPTLKPILLKHWKYALRLALSLHTWQIALDMLEGKRQTPAIDLLFAILSEDIRVRGRSLMVQSTKSFPDNWRLLVILAIVTEKIVQHLAPQDYSWFLSTFVRASATVIQGYLTVKNEPSQTNDRIDSDLKLISNCEQWITNFFIKMISSLKSPETDQDRRIILAAFSQICGALLQNEKGGQLLVEHLRLIQKAAGDFLTSHFSLKYVRETYLRQMKAKGYSLRLKKIQIPEEYSGNSEFSKEGICWLLLLYLREGADIYSKEYRVQNYLIAFSQSLESPLPLKEEAIKSIKSLWTDKISFQQLQYDYPLGLLLFNVFDSMRAELDYFKQKLGVGKDLSADLRRWKRLLTINLNTHNVEKITFVVNQISGEYTKEREILMVLKAIKFDFVDEASCKAFESLSSAIVSSHKEGKRVLAWLINRQRQGNRNPELCNKIAKILNA